MCCISVCWPQLVPKTLNIKSKVKYSSDPELNVANRLCSAPAMVDICYVRPPTLVFQCAGCRSILSDSDLFVCSIETLNVLVVTGVASNNAQFGYQQGYDRGYLSSCCRWNRDPH